MQLTQEHFDKGLTNLLDKVATKDDLTKLEAKMADKFDAQTKELKQNTNDAFETQQEWVDELFKKLII